MGVVCPIEPLAAMLNMLLLIRLAFIFASPCSTQRRDVAKSCALGFGLLLFHQVVTQIRDFLSPGTNPMAAGIAVAVYASIVASLWWMGARRGQSLISDGIHCQSEASEVVNEQTPDDGQSGHIDAQSLEPCDMDTSDFMSI